MTATAAPSRRQLLASETPPVYPSRFQLQSISSQVIQKIFANSRPRAGSICNPCACCCCTFCNLRINCIFMATTMIVTGILLQIAGSLIDPIKCEKEQPSGRIPSQCSAYVKELARIKSYRLIYFLGMYLSVLNHLTFAVFVFMAILKRHVVLPLVASVISLLSLITTLMFLFSAIVYSRKWPNLLLKSKDRTLDFADSVGNFAIVAFLISTVLHVYFSICCYQLSRQSKRGTDMNPHKPCCDKSEDPTGEDGVTLPQAPGYNAAYSSPSRIIGSQGYPPPRTSGEEMMS